MELGLRGKYALVTAASQGLGYACAEALVMEGARVTICSRNSQRIKKAVKKIVNEVGGDIEGFVCDLTNPEDIKQLVKKIKRRSGRIDILVFNHGNLPPGSFFDLDIKKWQEGLNQCFWPAIQLSCAVIPEMIEQRWGRIIFISSIFAKEPDPGYVVSSTLRAGLLGLAKCIAREVVSFGITVNTLLPGYFDTPLLRNLATQEAQRVGKKAEEVLQEWAAITPVGTIAKPRNLGSFVSFLCSEQAKHTTGTTLPIDGGFLKAIT